MRVEEIGPPASREHASRCVRPMPSASARVGQEARHRRHGDGRRRNPGRRSDAARRSRHAAPRRRSASARDQAEGGVERQLVEQPHAECRQGRRPARATASAGTAGRPGGTARADAARRSAPRAARPAARRGRRAAHAHGRDARRRNCRAPPSPPRAASRQVRASRERSPTPSAYIHPRPVTGLLSTSRPAASSLLRESDLLRRAVAQSTTSRPRRTAWPTRSPKPHRCYAPPAPRRAKGSRACPMRSSRLTAPQLRHPGRSPKGSPSAAGRWDRRPRPSSSARRCRPRDQAQPGDLRPRPVPRRRGGGRVPHRPRPAAARSAVQSPGGDRRAGDRASGDRDPGVCLHRSRRRRFRQQPGRFDAAWRVRLRPRPRRLARPRFPQHHRHPEHQRRDADPHRQPGRRHDPTGGVARQRRQRLGRRAEIGTDRHLRVVDRQDAGAGGRHAPRRFPGLGDAEAKFAG